MKPIQEAVLKMLADGSMSADDLYRSFHNGDSGISTRGFKNKQDYTALHRWVNLHVRPLVRARRAKQVGNAYEITPDGRSALEPVCDGIAGSAIDAQKFIDIYGTKCPIAFIEVDSDDDSWHAGDVVKITGDTDD